MNLYTFFMEFKGGTYISQVKALDSFQAMENWAAQLLPDQIEGFSQQKKQALIAAIPELIEDKFVSKINGMEHVWSFSHDFEEGFAMVHFVWTAS